MRRTPARFLLGLGTAVAVLLASAPALAVPSNKAECRRITRQVAHFVNVAEMADSRGDHLWLQHTLSHIDRLKERRVRLCPEWEEPNWAEIYAREFAKLLKKAGRVALTYLTFGAYPGL